jgi:hypothetical protein
VPGDSVDDLNELAEADGAEAPEQPDDDCHEDHVNLFGLPETVVDAPEICERRFEHDPVANSARLRWAMAM